MITGKEIVLVSLTGLVIGLVLNSAIVGNAVFLTNLDPLFISGLVAIPLLYLSRVLMRI